MVRHSTGVGARRNANGRRGVSFHRGAPLRALLAATTLACATLAAACADEDLTTPLAPSVAAGMGGAGMGPGLSVAQARASRLDQPLLVNGYVVAEGARVRLCEALRESFPPQCGGASIDVRGLDLGTLAGVETSGSVRWTSQPRQLLGELRGGVLTIAGTSKG